MTEHVQFNLSKCLSNTKNDFLLLCDKDDVRTDLKNFYIVKEWFYQYQNASQIDLKQLILELQKNITTFKEEERAEIASIAYFLSHIKPKLVDGKEEPISMDFPWLFLDDLLLYKYYYGPNSGEKKPMFVVQNMEIKIIK